MGEPNKQKMPEDSIQINGATMPDPSNFGSPGEFATAVFDLNEEGGSISRDRLIAMANCLFKFAQSESGGPEREIKRMLKQFAGPMADKEKCQNAAKEIVEKVGAEVIPFVAGEVFDWMDQDKDKGVSKDEVDLAVTAAMEGPSAAFGMIFQAIDHNKDGKLSATELSKFFAKLVEIAGKCALVFINVFAATFKDDLVDGITEEAFRHLDENEDGVLDKDELSQMQEGLGEVKSGLARVKENMADEEGVQKECFDFMMSLVHECKNAGDLDKDAFHALLTKFVESEIELGRKLLKNEDGELPIPGEIVDKVMPFIEITITTILSSLQTHMKEVSEAYFNLLDADSDGILQNSELMALVGVFDTDMTAEQSFDSLFAMVDTNADGKVENAECTEFFKKSFDVGVCAAKNLVELYKAVGVAVSAAFFKFLIDTIAGGEDLTEEKFNELAQGFAQDGPEVLLGALMQ